MSLFHHANACNKLVTLRYLNVTFVPLSRTLGQVANPEAVF